MSDNNRATIGEALMFAISMMKAARKMEASPIVAKEFGRCIRTLEELVAFTPEEFLNLMPPTETDGDLEEPTHH